ncbi:MAG: bifunctional phosphoribosylaminoimidazolecarboxamide formyltransferase/IMP cyclohydrolase [Bacillota bacterium]|nr:bifunctional phosphoribosylaminoimidazolecarboxamide formyltransferase/IMP cyclohydrolase [Bacillota bacterium]
MVKRAFLSVSDKTGIEVFARGLSKAGVEIISTGGTAAALKNAGIPVTEVSEVTGFPECLDGRVKTLHPKIHGGILAIREKGEHMAQLKKLGIKPIDLVCVNLYPFKKTILKENVLLEEAIENIDIGGPSMLRAAAKNWQDVVAITDVEDYSRVLTHIENGEDVPSEEKFKLAAKVFEYTAAYDALIAAFLREKSGNPAFPEKLTLTYEKVQDMRYGENPHQKAVFYKEIGAPACCLHHAEQLNGKALSYNNINDANGALELLREFSRPTAVAVKHANPCGVASAESIYEAYIKAYEADPVSIFGGIVAVNGEVDEKTALEMNNIFLEIIIAPSYTPGALEVLMKKQNLRVLKLPGINAPLPHGALDMKKVMGGLLVQERDSVIYDENEFKVVTKRAPAPEEMTDLKFAFKVVKYTRSNGIVIAKGEKTLGIGPGQTNRIWSVKMAIERSGSEARGAVLASDAFFPFSDCVEEAAKAGITAIIQPGGSIRDEDSIKECDKHGIAMVVTSVRHFKH